MANYCKKRKISSYFEIKTKDKSQFPGAVGAQPAAGTVPALSLVYLYLKLH